MKYKLFVGSKESLTDQIDRWLKEEAVVEICSQVMVPEQYQFQGDTRYRYTASIFYRAAEPVA